MEKKKILFVNDEMVMGGVARILCTLLKVIDKDKYDIDLLILHKHGELLDEIPDDINVIEGSKFFDTVDIPFKDASFSQKISKMKLFIFMKTGAIKNKIIKERKILLNKQYDIEFSAKEGFCTIFSAFGDSKKKINWVQTDYKENNYASNHMNLLKQALQFIDMNIACSEQVSNSFKEVFGVNNITVIHNPVDNNRIKELSEMNCEFKLNKNKINLITVCRFHPQKALHRLIKAYANNKENFSLTIVGDGELYNELHNLALDLGVDNDINWTGILSNPYPLIKNSDIFVLPSKYEGYPTITIESLISRTPVLSTDVAGISEQINNSNGWIVENNDDSIDQFLKNNNAIKEEIKNKKYFLINYRYDNDSLLNSIYKIFNN